MQRSCWTTAAWLAALVAASPLAAQDFTVAAGLFAQSQPGVAPTRWGSGGVLAVDFGSGQAPIRAEVGYARTDYSVLGDDYHSHYGNVLVGLASRGRPGRDRTNVGLYIGVGARVRDDVSETDPTFASSAEWQSLVSPGFTFDVRLTESTSVAVLARYYLTGIAGSIIDSAERDVRSSFGLMVGLRR
ncbi:MAG: hypothetical protein R3E10_14135 [Gemmatimonadota bacterium]